MLRAEKLCAQHRFWVTYHHTYMAKATHIEDRQFQLIAKALADPHRFEMLQKIASAKEAPTCSCVRECLNLSPATISHHVKELHTAGLIDVERNGKFMMLRLRRDIWKAYLKRLAAI